jgi:hypothetical protein
MIHGGCQRQTARACAPKTTPPIRSWARRVGAATCVAEASADAFLAEHRYQLFPPELFADLARQGGGPAPVPAEAIGTVMVLRPCRDGTGSGRAAVRQVRGCDCPGGTLVD